MLHFWHSAVCKLHYKIICKFAPITWFKTSELFKVLIWTSEYIIYTRVRSSLLKMMTPFGPESTLSFRLQSYAKPRQLTALSLLPSTVLQARWCAPTSHTWWDRPPALLPLAPGDICGGSSHCGPDHLCQEPSSQGRSYEEAQVLLKESRHAECKAQKLCSSAHVYLQNLFPGTAGGRGRERAPRGSRNSPNWETGNLVYRIPCVIAIANGSSS